MNIVNKGLLKKIYNELKLDSKVSQIELAIRRYYKILKDNGYIVQQSSGRKTIWHIIKRFYN